MTKTELRPALIIEVISGVEGPCLCVGDGDTGRRVAGPKPWGGGRTVQMFKVDPKRLLEALQEYAPGDVQPLHELGKELVAVIRDPYFATKPVSALRGMDAFKRFEEAVDADD